MKFSCSCSWAWKIAPSLKSAFGFIIARSCIMMNVNWWLFSPKTFPPLILSFHVFKKNPGWGWKINRTWLDYVRKKGALLCSRVMSKAFREYWENQWGNWTLLPVSGSICFLHAANSLRQTKNQSCSGTKWKNHNALCWVMM